MNGSVEYAGTFTEEAAIHLAEAWAVTHHKDRSRSRDFAIHWYRDANPDTRDGDGLRRDLSFFFEASAKDAIYWRSVGDFTEEATGVWGLQALKALAYLNLTGALVAMVLFFARSGSVSTIGTLFSGIVFVIGLLLAIPALKLTAASRTRANASSALHSHKAQTASTWEQLRDANNADPNVGRDDRKAAVQLALAMIATATIGCIGLIVTAWL